MTSDASNLAEHVSAFPSEARPTPPSDDSIAASLRGFGPLGLFAILLIVLTSVFKPLSAILVLVWTWRSHTPWREIGYVRPRSWISSLAVGIVFGCAFKLFMKAIVMPLLGAPAINPAYHYLAGNRAALPGVVFMMIVGAGFAEETLFRGYLFERLQTFRDWGRRKSIHLPPHLRVVCLGPLLQPGASWGRTGDDHGARLWHDLRNHRPDLDGYVCP